MATSTALQQIPLAVRGAREEAGLTQAELGEFVGTDRFAIAAIERGRLTAQVRRLIEVLDAVGLEIQIHPRTHRLAASVGEGPNHV
jgi:DNA-binding XRE family transcriptional regulator